MTLVALLTMTAQTTAQPTTQTSTQSSSDVDTLTAQDTPRPITALMRCASPSGTITRRAFAGGFVFTQTCAGKGEPQQRLVFATDRVGSNPHLLKFHRPEGRRLSTLNNVTFAAAQKEIAGDIGRLSRRICRAEGRWRMEGKQPAPALVYWRQTRNCDGKSGWQVLVNRMR